MTHYSAARKALSAVLLLALLVGVPMLLLAAGGNPLPSSVPSMGEVTRALSRPDDGTLLMGIITVLAWVAWALFVLLIALEVPAQLTGRRAPRLPGLGGAQNGARWLVAPLLSVAALTGVGTAASADEAPTATTAASSTTAADTQEQSPVSVAAGDSLWQIAETHLGDGTRWQEIYDLNREVISDKDLILPGQELRLPGGKTVTVTPTSDRTAGHQQTPSPATTGQDRTDLGPVAGEHTASQDVGAFMAPEGTQAAPSTGQGQGTQPGATAGGRDTTEPAPREASQPTPSPRPQVASPEAQAATGDPAQDADVAEESDEDPVVSQGVLGVSALGAVGLVGILAGARALQRRRRKPGQRIAMPEEETAELETDLTQSADPIGAEDLDRALRTLSHLTSQAGQPLPGLRAARLTDTHVELFTADVDRRLPDPFITVDNVDGVYLLERDRIGDLLEPAQAEQVPAPYPALFTLGQDEDQAWVLLNLEQIGSLGLDGPEEECRAVLAAAALELIASTWSDDLRVTLVGDLQDLSTAMAHDRVDYAASVAEILQPVAYAATAHGRNLEHTGVATVTEARGEGVADETWTPHLILLGTEPTPDERDELAKLVTSSPRVAVATITTHTEPITDWELQMTDGSQAVLHPVGMNVWAQRVHPGQYEELVELLGLTQQPTTPGPAWTANLDDTQVLPTVSGGGGEATSLPDLSALLDPTNADGTAGTDAVSVSDSSATSSVLELNDLPAPKEHAGQEDHDDTTAGDQGPEGPTEGATALGEEPASSQDTQPVATVPVEEPDAAATPDAVDAAGQEDEDNQQTAGTVTQLPTTGPMLRLLGEVDILDAQGKRPRSPGIATEAIAFLALHPTEDRDEFDAALWPSSTPAASTRAARLSQARTWLGHTSDGEPYVPMVDDAGYRLSEAVRVDWHQLLQLIGQDITAASTTDLQQALDLVDGAPMSGVNPKRYGWAVKDREEMIATIGDLAAVLATRYLNAGRAQEALAASEVALGVDPACEALWRYKLRAAHRLGQADSVMHEMTETLEAVEGDLDEETITLMESISRTDGRAHA